MDSAQSTIDKFKASIVVTQQFRLRQKLEVRELTFLAEADWPPPFVGRTSEILVDGNKYHQTLVRGFENGSQQHWKLAFDGEHASGYRTRRTHTQGHRGSRPVWNEADLQEPRQLAYRNTEGDSRITLLRELADEGLLSVRRETLDKQQVFLIDALPKVAAEDRNWLKLWVAPHRNWLPLRIEKYFGTHLVYRFTDIKHTQVSPDVWFPIGGRLEHIEYIDSQHRGKIRSTMDLEVVSGTLDLAPELRPDSFRLDFPPGTFVVDGVAHVAYWTKGSGTEENLADERVDDKATTRPGASMPGL